MSLHINFLDYKTILKSDLVRMLTSTAQEQGTKEFSDSEDSSSWVDVVFTCMTVGSNTKTKCFHFVSEFQMSMRKQTCFSWIKLITLYISVNPPHKKIGTQITNST